MNSHRSPYCTRIVTMINNVENADAGGESGSTVLKGDAAVVRERRAAGRAHSRVREAVHQAELQQAAASGFGRNADFDILTSVAANDLTTSSTAGEHSPAHAAAAWLTTVAGLVGVAV